MSFAPSALVLAMARAAGHRVELADVRLELIPPGPDDAPTWTSAAFLRQARGDRAEAARRAAAVPPQPGDAVAHVRTDGLVAVRLRPGIRAWPSADWAQGLPAPRVAPGGPRSLENPWYRAQLAYARLTRALARQAPPRPSPGVIGLLPDAVRVAERAALEAKPHHLVDWIARAGAAVVTWAQDDDTPAHDPDPVGALRDALASALRAAGLDPTERL